MRTVRFLPVLASGLLSTGAGAQNFTLVSSHPEAGGGFGTVVASVPDTNGDGIADVIVGAYNQKVGDIAGAGRITIHSGANGALLRVIVSPGKQVFGWFGGSVAGVPDVSGDGKGDILVGAYNEINGGTPDSGHGRVYLFNGATGQWMRTLNSPNGEPGGGFGRSVAGLGDITGDGKGDLAVGAYREDPNAAPEGAGRVYIYNGATGALLKTVVSNAQVSGGLFGVSLGVVPDANGDGKNDLAVGAYGETAGGITGAGRAHLVNPLTGTIFKTLTPSKPETGGGFGSCVGGVADVNGDGRGDVIVGAPLENAANVINSGRAYLFSGAAGTLLKVFASGAPEAGDVFGSGVAGIPDVNGDDRGDILIGAAHADPGGAIENSGRVYIFSGANGAFIRSIGSPNPATGGSFGNSVAGAPDANNNGKGEAIIGAPVEDTQTVNDVGRAYIVRN